MDERHLIDAAKRGDVRAFNTLVLHYQQPAYNFALRIMGDPAAAADATQDAFIAAYGALNQYTHGNFKGWLFRIVNNKCYDVLRRGKRHPEPSIDEITEENESPSFLSDVSNNPETLAEQGDLVNQIERCLQGLPEEQRATVLLCDVEGYDYSEIASILAISLGTVKSRLNRARGKLQDCLRDYMELLPSRYR